MKFKIVSREEAERHLRRSRKPPRRPKPPPSPEQEARRAALVAALRAATPDMEGHLKDLKRLGRKLLERDDFVWHALLTSMATMGNSRGYDGLIGDRSNYDRVTYEALASLAPDRRVGRLDRVLRDAKVRRPAQKAVQLDANFERVRAMGGPIGARREALASEGKEGKVAFMMSFDGVGDKYGRNIWMDVAHPDFQNAVAVDSRIESVTERMGYSFRRYEDHEEFYLGVADEAGRTGWETDRLLYHYTDHFLDAVP